MACAVRSRRGWPAWAWKGEVAMAGEVSAADGALKAGATAVAQSRAELKQQLKALEGNLSGIGAKWKGQGAVAFGALMVRWNEDANKIINALDTFEANLVS